MSPLLSILDSNATQILIASLIFARGTALLTTSPIFRARNIPIAAKAGLALLLMLLILPNAPLVPVPESIFTLMVLVSREIAIGLVMGQLVQLIFIAAQVAGQMIDMEMGFHMANVLDPMADAQLPLVGNFYYLLGTLVFLSLNGHLLVLAALNHSLRLVPPGQMAFSFSADMVINAFTRMFLLAFQIALPVVGASLFTSLIFGLMAKAVPQMNVFIVGMPAKVLLLATLLVIVLPGYLWVLERSLGEAFFQLGQWISSGVTP